MNLTKDSTNNNDAAHDLIEVFFDDVLMPMAASMRASGTEPFRLKPDASRGSYYMRRPKRSMTRDDFTAPSCDDIKDLELRLAAYWQSIGRHNFASEISHIAAAARAAYAPGEQDAEVSSFIYTMF